MPDTYELTTSPEASLGDSILVESVIKFADRAKSLVVSDQASYQGANAALREVATLAKRVDERRNERTKPIDETKREIMEFFRQGEDVLKGARAALEQQIRAYGDEQRRIAAEQQRKANEAAEKERRRIEQVAAKAAERGDMERAVAHAERAATVAAPVIAAPVTKAEGVSTRTIWLFEVTDFMQLPANYLTADLKAIQGVVDALKANAPRSIPGIRVWSEERTVVRGSR